MKIIVNTPCIEYSFDEALTTKEESFIKGVISQILSTIQGPNYLSS